MLLLYLYDNMMIDLYLVLRDFLRLVLYFYPTIRFKNGSCVNEHIL
jgi:hypothetical protein